MKILVLGSSGMLGSRLVPYLFKQGHEVQSVSRTDMGENNIDLQDELNTLGGIQRVNPEVVINLVGMTDVDRCESHPKEAWQSNVRTAENIARACSVTGAHLVHLSSDQVYDSVPACMEADACPGNYYGVTKYSGELAALAASASVLRTNFFGLSPHANRRSLSDWLFSALQENRQIQVFNDVHFSPLNMTTVCIMINEVVMHRHTGVFNLGSSNCMSKADFAFAFADAVGLSSNNLSRVNAKHSGLLNAWRPKNMCMNSSRFEAVFDVCLPSLQTEIARVAKEYRDQI